MMRAALLATVVVGLLSALALPPVASAGFGVAPGSLTAAMLDKDGNPEIRAGAHPDVVRIAFAVNTLPSGQVDGNVKDTVFEFPPGFVGAANAVPKCPREQLSLSNPVECPPETQVGTALLNASSFLPLTVPIYNVEPGPGALADFGFEAILVANHMVSRMRPDGGVAISMENAVQDAPLIDMTLELWGVPADHQTGASIPRRVSITTPTGCGAGAPAITLKMRSWQDPDTWQTATTELGQAPIGCENQSFDPQLDFGLDHSTSDTSTGAEIGLTVPQNDDPDGLASARVKDVSVRMPEGMAFALGAASALTPCSDEAFGLGQPGSPTCPLSSRMGTVEMTTGLLDAPISGALYLGSKQFQLLVAMEAPGVEFKLEGALLVDPDTGQLTTQLSDLPDLPFERMTLKFGGAGGGLVTPLDCGDATATATLTPYGGGAPVTSSDVVTVTRDGSGAPCPATLPFAPTFLAGTSPARAGAAAGLAMVVGRRDGDRLLGRFSATLPPGLGARLGSVEPCADAAVAASTCPAASRIGSAVAEVGPGESPLSLEGDVFLTGRYRGAPFGLAIAFPGRVGPFDLGTVSVRAGLRLDPRTAQVTVESDAMPSSVLGMPLRIQSFAIDIDRPGFLVNPTSCAPQRIGAEIASVDGTIARAAAPFGVGGCRELGFSPSASMALTNPSTMYAGGHPGLRIRIRSGAGRANIRRVDVGLPKLLGLALDQITAICSRAEAEQLRCPEAARVGRALARTPLVPQPLKGGVYIVQRDGGLPDLWALMRGSGVALSVPMETVAGDGRLHSKIAGLPDVPLSNLTLQFASGAHGIFKATSRPCRGVRPRLIAAGLRLTAHSRARRSIRTRVSAGRGCSDRATGRRAGRG